ncbi:MAG: DUF4286 family protein [Proteobacteria bacterium]|nr:DUF4286 family protein [Pseudomonadota bacterium]
MTVIYEVNLKIAQSILAEYLAWLPGHITQMCQQEGFLSASFFEDISDENESKKSSYGHYIVQYQVASMTKLQHYFDNAANAMRTDARDRFGDKFTVTRRVLQPKTL